MGVAVTVAAAVVSAIGAGLTIAGQVQSAEAQRDQAELNADMALDDAMAAHVQGALEVDRLKDIRNQDLTRQTHIFGKSGVTLEGSPLITMQKTAAAIERDIVLTKKGAKDLSKKYETQAQFYYNHGVQVMNQLPLQIAGTLATSATSFIQNFGGSNFNPQPTAPA